MTIDVRPAAVAGRFYPDRPDRLRETVQELLDRASIVRGPDRERPTPKAIVAPHAGYQYSGPIAATAYAWLAPDNGLVSRVIVAGPAHFWPVGGVAVPSVRRLRHAARRRRRG